MSAKTYAEPQQICCMATLDNCKTCQGKDNCLILNKCFIELSRVVKKEAFYAAS